MIYVCIYERTNTAELKKLLINLIFELDDKANDNLLLNAQKRRHLRKKNKERKKNLLPSGSLCLILLYVALMF